MYAFIRLGGHQHKVTPDMILLSERTDHASGTEFICSDVLLVSAAQEQEGEKVKTEPQIGAPTLAGAQVKLRVLGDVRAPKINGFKYKKRKGYRRSWGHRQNLQKLQVVSIQAGA